MTNIVRVSFFIATVALFLQPASGEAGTPEQCQKMASQKFAGGSPRDAKMKEVFVERCVQAKGRKKG